MKKNIVFLVVLSLTFFFPGKSSADAAPEPPSCALDMDYSQTPHVPKKPTCGYFTLNSMLDLTSYADKFVFIQSESCNNVVEYTLAKPEYRGTSGRIKYVQLIAVDKDYFQTNGGLGGIFIHKSISSSEECDSSTPFVDTMEPKNSTDFKKHSYTFVVSKTDPNFYNVIDEKYADYYNLSGYDYLPTTDMSCTAATCSEMVVYGPEKIDGHYIVVAPKKIDYTPASLAKYAPYVEKSLQPSTNPNPKNAVVPPNPQITPPSTPTPHLSWIRRVLNSIGSFFKKIF